jgi:hypothetical protein
VNVSHIPLLHHTKRSGNVRTTAAIIARVCCLGVLAAGFISHPVFAADDAAHRTKRAYFAQESASEDARHVADWIVDSSDNHNLPFLIVDKKNAKVFVFDETGQIKGAASALLGMAHGDDSVPGIGQRKLSTIRPDERTTPAGRFVANLARNLHGREILWVDYDAAISLHPVITRNPKEQRAERLASPTTADNRISYGCINVPVKFYEHVVSPAFKETNGIVYVLPETRSPRETFGSYDVVEHARRPIAPAAPAPLPAQDKSSVGSIIKLR